MMENSGVDNLKNFIKELEQHKLFIICRCEASYNFPIIRIKSFYSSYICFFYRINPNINKCLSWYKLYTCHSFLITTAFYPNIFLTLQS